MANIFQDPTKSLPKRDAQIVRVPMTEVEIGARKDHMPAADTSGDIIHLRSARMAIRFGTTRGVLELAETGPMSSSKISARADIEARKITAIFEVTSDATAKWEEAK